MSGLPGPLVKAIETVKVFARRRPAVSELLASRRRSFDRAHVLLPSTAAPGEELSPTVQVWDDRERLYPGFAGGFAVEATDGAAILPTEVTLSGDHGGYRTVDGVTFETPGVQYLALSRNGDRFVSNPVLVGEDLTPVRWADLHLHSTLSDGSGRVEEGLRFGRDVMALDAVAYTDHDTMGFFIPPSLQRRRMHERSFDRLLAAADSVTDPGEFVAVPAYEWTKQPNRGGHLNVYFDDTDGAALFDSMAADSDSYERLWARLREFNDAGGTRALSVPHHPAEGMYPFDFSSVEYDDDLAPLVEVYSQWGSSERPGSAGNRFPLAMGQGEVDEPGHYVRDALAMGARVGLMASSDYHGPHPGHSLIHARPHLPSLAEWRDAGLGWGNIWRVWDEQSYPGGLCAFTAPELTQEGVFDALWGRRVYGTTQPDRLLVSVAVDGVGVGDDRVVDSRPRDRTVRLDAPDDGREVAVAVAGTAPLSRVTVLKNTEPWRRWEGTTEVDADLDTYTMTATWTDGEPVAGVRWDDERGSDADIYYLRARQADGGTAWAGPVWVEAGDPAGD